MVSFLNTYTHTHTHTHNPITHHHCMYIQTDLLEKEIIFFLTFLAQLDEPTEAINATAQAIVDFEISLAGVITILYRYTNTCTVLTKMFRFQYNYTHIQYPLQSEFIGVCMYILSSF